MYKKEKAAHSHVSGATGNKRFMKNWLIFLWIIPAPLLGQVTCVDTQSEDGYELTFNFGPNLKQNDACVREQIAKGNKEVKKIKVVCEASTDEIPASFFLFKQARHIRLEGRQEPDWNNCGKETLPDAFATFSKLEELQIVYLPVSGLGNLSFPNLERFTAHYTCLTFIPEVLLGSKKLKEISISYSDLKEIPTSISRVVGLQKLDVSSTGINTLPDALFSLGNLTSLSINGTNVSTIPDGIGKLNKLETLSALTMAGIEKCSPLICDLPNLKHFSGVFGPENVRPGCFNDTNVWKCEGTDCIRSK